MATKAIEGKEEHPLEKIIEKTIKAITNDGRVFVGVLRGLDQAMNCLLNDCEQRVYSLEGTKKEPLGVFFLRGDTIVMIGQFNEDQEGQLEFQAAKCGPLPKCQ